MQGICIHSAIVRGCVAYPIDIEVSMSHGIPGISIIGLPNKNVLEVRSRLRSALRACDFKVPRQHITINLLPTHIKKSGTSLDLGICIAILLASGQIALPNYDRYLFCGEVGLDGTLIGDSFASLYAKAAKDKGLTACIAAQSPLRISEGVVSIKSLVNLNNYYEPFKPHPNYIDELPFEFSRNHTFLDYKDIYGQEGAKRALMLCAVGRHSIVMKGPAGVGKTMLAQAFPSIAPNLTDDCADEVCAIYGSYGLNRNCDFNAIPFRSPHHSATSTTLIGAKKNNLIGEITLAHRGVLFLDELGEFNLKLLNELRVPFEQKYLIGAYDGLNYKLPCDFQLLAATNTCPCSYLGSPHHECSCSKTQISNYEKRLNSPLLQRVDMHINLEAIDLDSLIKTQKGLSSKNMRDFVDQAIEFKNHRLLKLDDFTDELPDNLFSQDAYLQLEKTAKKLHLSGRTFMKAKAISRTIADLELSDRVEKIHVMEALGYCSRV